tara:strand:+ start:1992 stop:3758 length:1767 start_codon:yes stop_codon:yes gene_type:complete
MNFSLYYRKNKNEELFQSLEKSSLGLEKLQNYVPLYEKFFSLNPTNCNSINLNQKYYIHSLIEEMDKNKMKIYVSDNSNNLVKKDTFCKYSPLLDPLKYLTGKYDLSGNDIISLPQFNTDASFPKLQDKNNSAYVDSFFTYLSSQLLHNYSFLNSIDYYGAFICEQEKFIYNIGDDIDYLNENDFFHETLNGQYTIENEEHARIFNIDSRTNKRKLVINDKLEKVDIDTFSSEDFSVFTSNKGDNGKLSVQTTPVVQIVDLSDVCIYNYPVKKSSSVSSSSTFSSKSSNTSIDSDDGEDDDDYGNKKQNGSDDDDSGDDSDDDASESSCESDEEDVFCSIFNFPVQMIALEKCENTLDYLMENDLLKDHEWTSCLFQIIISLSIFQKTFSFTHNDLHTNNIMYIPTEKQFLYYTFNKTTYKVPTYGKIYKIIDFGRAIYKFNGQLMCSDSFHPKGDAASQYNCDPYLDENKPRLEPNPSFDLCRLACCLYDHFVEDIFDSEEILKKNKIAKLVGSWLMDDKDRNILYKNSGEERYPEFKLYKMIARTIHKAVPSVQLENGIFKKYVTSKKKLNKSAKIMNLDAIPNLQ